MDLNDDEIFGKVRKERVKERRRITTTEVCYCLVTWYRLSSTFLLSIDSFFLSLSLPHSFFPSLPHSLLTVIITELFSFSNFTFSFPFSPSPFIYFLFSKNHLASTWREEESGERRRKLGREESWYYCFVGFGEVRRERERESE